MIQQSKIFRGFFESERTKASQKRTKQVCAKTRGRFLHGLDPKRKFVARDRMSPIEVKQPFRIAAAWESQLGNPIEAKNASFREKTPR
jgi:hypothetical protein